MNISYGSIWDDNRWDGTLNKGNTFNLNGITGVVLPDGTIKYDNPNYIPFSQRSLPQNQVSSTPVMENNTFNMGGRKGRLTPNGIVYDDPNYIPFSQKPLETTVVVPQRELPQGISEPNLDDALRYNADKLNAQALAKAIIANKFGNGSTRVQNLLNKGYSLQEIKEAQKIVNQLLRRK